MRILNRPSYNDWVEWRQWELLCIHMKYVNSFRIARNWSERIDGFGNDSYFKQDKFNPQHMHDAHEQPKIIPSATHFFVFQIAMLQACQKKKLIEPSLSKTSCLILSKSISKSFAVSLTKNNYLSHIAFCAKLVKKSRLLDFNSELTIQLDQSDPITNVCICMKIKVISQWIFTI